MLFYLSLSLLYLLANTGQWCGPIWHYTSRSYATSVCDQ